MYKSEQRLKGYHTIDTCLGVVSLETKNALV